MVSVLTLVKLTRSSESEWKAGARRPGFCLASGPNQVTLFLWLLAYSSVKGVICLGDYFPKCVL